MAKRRYSRRRRDNPESTAVIALLALAGAGAYIYVEGQQNKLPAELQGWYDKIKTWIASLTPLALPPA